MRWAFRLWSRDWRTALFAVLTLALTIGANTAFFAVADAVLLQPLPYQNPDDLVLIHGQTPRYPGRRLSLSPLDLLDLQAADGFSAMSGVSNIRLTWWNGEFNEPVAGARASANFFELMGVLPLYGRVFQPSDKTDHEPVALLSHHFFQSRFGGDPGVVGSTMTLDERPWTILGVLPPEFSFYFPNARDVWLPLVLDESERSKRRYRFLEVVGRLAPGASLESAQSSLDTISLRLEKTYPETNRDLRFRAVSFFKQRLGHLARPFWILFGALLVVLLAGCSNVSSMLLTKAASRRRELAVRRSLGATGQHLFRQTAAESLTLALAGGAAGLVVAFLAADLLSALVPADLPRIGRIAVDLRVALFTLALAAAAGLICAAAPGLTLKEGSLSTLLSAPGRSGMAGKRESRILGGIVALQIGFALALSVGAGLLLETYLNLRWLKTGFDPTGVTALYLNIPRERYTTDRQRAALLSEIERRVNGVGGVRSVGFTTSLPFSGTAAWIGFKPSEDAEESRTTHSLVAGDYFGVMGIRFLRGEAFSSRGGDLSPPPVVISESLARRLGGPDQALGRTILLTSRDKSRPRQVVGVVEDVRIDYQGNRGGECVYEPFSVYAPYYAAMTVKLEPGAAPPAEALKRRAARAEPQMVLYAVQAFDRLMAEGLARQSFLSRLFVGFAAIGLALLLLGVYGVVGFIGKRRTQEIGVRLALGASAADVHRLLLGAVAPFLAAGLALGLAASWAVTRFLNHWLEGGVSADLPTFVAAGLLVAAVAFASALQPARQASRIDPSDLLRV